MDPGDHVISRYDKSSLSSAITCAIGIEVHHQIILIDEGSVDLVSQTQSQREPVAEL